MDLNLAGNFKFAELSVLLLRLWSIVPAGVVVQMLMVILIYCVVHTLWIRAKTVEQLPVTGYVIAPIFFL